MKVVFILSCSKSFLVPWYVTSEVREKEETVQVESHRSRRKQWEKDRDEVHIGIFFKKVSCMSHLLILLTSACTSVCSLCTISSLSLPPSYGAHFLTSRGEQLRRISRSYDMWVMVFRWNCTSLLKPTVSRSRWGHKKTFGL